jgi:hypothetical protein
MATDFQLELEKFQNSGELDDEQIKTHSARFSTEICA